MPCTTALAKRQSHILLYCVSVVKMGLYVSQRSVARGSPRYLRFMHHILMESCGQHCSSGEFFFLTDRYQNFPHLV